jgi:hypothetical protein
VSIPWPPNFLPWHLTTHLTKIPMRYEN